MPLQSLTRAAQGVANFRLPSATMSSIAQKTKMSPLPQLPKIEMPKVEMPKVPEVPNMMGQMTSGLKQLGNFLPKMTEQVGGLIPDRASMAGFMTQKTPPLSMYTHNLGPLQSPANSALGWVQNQVSNNPQQFGRLASTLGAPLTRNVLGVPGLGMPGMLGMYGLLSGGQPMEDIYRLFSPLINGRR